LESERERERERERARGTFNTTAILSPFSQSEEREEEEEKQSPKLAKIIFRLAQAAKHKLPPRDESAVENDLWGNLRAGMFRPLKMI
jgi:hypothetical protein